MKKLLLITILTITLNTLSQNNLPKPEAILGKGNNSKQNSKSTNIKNLDDWTFINEDFKSKVNRIEYMSLNMDMNILKYKIYNNSFHDIYSDEKSIFMVDSETKFSKNGVLLTIKMSENSVFVILFLNLCDINEKVNGKVSITFFNYQYGEINKNSVKTLDVLKNRLYTKNNLFTEEIIFGNFKFKVEEKTELKTLKFQNKIIPLERRRF